MEKPAIHPDISRAATLPADFYRDPHYFQICREKIWARCWNYIDDCTVLPDPQTVFPFTLLPNLLDEPLFFSRDAQQNLHCLSNVCTHRASLLIEKAGQQQQITCGYHGRCFNLNGTFKSMPCFEQTRDFPTAADNLTAVPIAQWADLLFVALEPKVPFPALIAPIQERLPWFPLEQLHLAPTYSQTYTVQAHWALYCDNYLEGFHIPFVHPGLNRKLAFQDYDYELFPYGSLQLGVAKTNESCFELPADSPDYGKNILAYYFWVFPNLMFNFYPWGLSLNIIRPLGLQTTAVEFRTYLLPGQEAAYARSGIHQTELEDEAIVEKVQRGMQSRFYRQGRFSAQQEIAVHHFHRLLADWL